MCLNYSHLEILPDEMILEICRYLHCGDVLYSFFGLNSRINRTILFYCQHVSLHRTFYTQFSFIFTNILPRIDLNIRSLVIFELESPPFLSLFQNNYYYPCLEKLTLVNWTDEKLIVFMDTLHGMVHLEKLVIQALDLTESVKNRDLLKKTLGANDNRLREVLFDHECDAFNLTTDNHIEIQFPNIIKLNIELQTTTDLIELTKITPNVEKLNITFKRPWTSLPSNEQTFLNLTEFSVYAMSWFSTFEHFKLLMNISSTVEYLSLVLVTHDQTMVDKEHVYSLLPPSIKQFNYSICYKPSDRVEESIFTAIVDLWRPIPIVYSINQNDQRIFLHTLPYQPNRLALRSLFGKHMSAPSNSYIYRSVHHVHVYDTMALIEIFDIIKHCRNTVDLIVSIRPLPSRNSEIPKGSTSLPLLPRLDFLSIQGIPMDIHNIEQIVSSAPNLLSLSLDFDCLFKLLNDDDQTLNLFYLLFRRIVVLCVRFEDASIEQITSEHIHCIARIFYRVNHMCLDLRNSKLRIESHIISLILNYFPKLIVLSLYGQLSDNLNSNKDTLREYLIEQSNGRLKDINSFYVGYGNERLKIWI